MFHRNLQWHTMRLAILLAVIGALAGLNGCVGLPAAAELPLATELPATDEQPKLSMPISQPTASEQPVTVDQRPAGWAEASHSNDAEPNYAIVFPQDRVNTITITISSATWQAMQSNMTELFGAPGTRRFGPGRGAPPPGAPPITATAPISGNVLLAPPPDGFGGGPGGGPPADFTTENPLWVTATVEFAGKIWHNVGVRYKGNSSLMTAWNSQSSKLPLKFDFDQFETEYPAINNQRFYGFKQLSLANGFGDPTYMREALTYDILAEAGLVAAETAYYEVFLDRGEGVERLGLYTAIEVIDDTVIQRVFGEDRGNIYEGDGRGANLATTTVSALEESFQKENNQQAADWSDIKALYDVLHSPQRTSDPVAWRTRLESIFEVQPFLRWLAISAVIQHWDTYGAMNHNFYLYHNPATDKLTWISWDHNLVMGGTPAFGGGPGGRPAGEPPAPPPNGGGPGGRRGFGNVTLDRANIDSNWPLIRYLLDDPIYHASYVAAVEATHETLFNSSELAPKIARLSALLAPYASADNDPATFASAVQALEKFIADRAATVEKFLSEAQ